MPSAICPKCGRRVRARQNKFRDWVLVPHKDETDAKPTLAAQIEHTANVRNLLWFSATPPVNCSGANEPADKEFQI